MKRLTINYNESQILIPALREYIANNDLYTANGVVASDEVKLLNKIFNFALFYEEETDPFYEAYKKGVVRE